MGPRRYRDAGAAILKTRRDQRDTREREVLRRALAVVAGLLLAAAALYALLTGSQAPPSAEIDEGSRRQLEAVLRDATEAAP
jgi:hypothetical protein